MRSDEHYEEKISKFQENTPVAILKFQKKSKKLLRIPLVRH